MTEYVIHVYDDGAELYWIDDKELTKEEFEARVKYELKAKGE